MAANVNQLSGRRKLSTGAPTSERLIQCAKPEEGQERSKNGHGPSAEAICRVPTSRSPKQAPHPNVRNRRIREPV